MIARAFALADDRDVDESGVAGILFTVPFVPPLLCQGSLDLFMHTQASDVTRWSQPHAHTLAAAKAKFGTLGHVTKSFRWAEEIRSTLGGGSTW